MRRLLQKIISPFFTWLAEKFSAAPLQAEVFKSLSKLYHTICANNPSAGVVLPINPQTDSFIIFSDQHKGAKNFEDDFSGNEANYVAALCYYHEQGFHYINLGDAEELWKNAPDKITAAYPEAFNAEANFQTANRYYRTFGNHDLLWKNKLDVVLFLKKKFPLPLTVHEGIVLRINTPGQPTLDLFCTHGHQGDIMSDNNAFSTWVIAHIWAPIQGFLRININTPANDFLLRNKHNRMMYEWSSQRQQVLLITGHTHQPVFASGRYTTPGKHNPSIETPAAVLQPSYFNTGCCCFNDGDITGIEISEGYIRLIKWYKDLGVPRRKVLEEKLLADLVNDLNH